MDDFALKLQARMQRTTLPEPHGNPLLAIAAGLLVAVGAMVAISYLGGHMAECVRSLRALADATARVLEGG